MNKIQYASGNQYLINHIEIYYECNENGWVVRLDYNKASFILYESNDTNISVVVYYLVEICTKILQSIKKIRNTFKYGFHKFLKSKPDTLDFGYFNIIIIPNFCDEYNLDYYASYMNDEYISTSYIPKKNLTSYLNHQLLILEKHISEFLKKIQYTYG